MLAGIFFGPKWKHRKPTVRKEALLALDPGEPESQTILSQVAKQDSDINLRILAVKRLESTSDLFSLINDVEVSQIKQEASKRLAQLLAGNGLIKQDEDQLVTMLKSINDADIFEYVAKQGRSAQLRIAALLKIDKNTFYQEAATSDASLEVRQLAVDNINKPAALERIIKASRRKDKQIYNIAKQKLDQINDMLARPTVLREKAKLLATELSAVVYACKERDAWTLSENQVENLAKEWQQARQEWIESMGEWDQELSRKFEEDLALFYEKLSVEKANALEQQAFKEQYAPINEEKLRIFDELEQMREEVLSANLSDQYKAIKSKWAELTERWVKLDMPFLGTAIPRTKNEIASEKKRYEQLVSQLDSALSQLDKYLKAERKASDLINDIDSLLATGEPVPSKVTQEYQIKWKRILFPAQRPQSDSQSQRFNNALEKLNEKIKQQQDGLVANKLDFSNSVKELAVALQAGKAKHAINVCRHCEKLLEGIEAMGEVDKKTGTEIKQFAECRKQVRELQSWRKWSNQPVKEQLCLDLETLAEDVAGAQGNINYSYTNAMAQLKSYRNDWQRLSATEGRSNKELQQRFDTACQKVHEICQAFFDQQAQKRDTNLKSRETYCLELEQYFETIKNKEDEEIDWKALSKILRVAQQEWRTLGITDSDKKSDINQRFRQAIDAIKSRQQVQWDRNKEQKLQFIARAEQLLEKTKLDNIEWRDVVSAVKNLQTQWKSIGTSSQDKETWQQFQTVCNAIFAHHDEVEKGKVAERNQLEEKGRQLCLQIESLAKLDGEEFKQAIKEVEKVKQQWADDPLLSQINSLDKRFNKACHLFEAQNERRKVQEIGKNKLIQYQLAEICGAMESCISMVLRGEKSLAEVDTEYQELQQRYEHYSTGNDVVFKALTNRIVRINELHAKIEREGIESIVDKVKKDEQASLSQKRQLCLQFEILAQVESPAEFKTERMEYQLSVLAEHMKGAQAQASDDKFQDTIVSWHKSGFVMHPDDQILQERFLNAYRSIVADN